MLFGAMLAMALQTPAKVQFVRLAGGRYELRVNQKPFFVKGVGGDAKYFPELRRLGANSIRTWGVAEDTQAMLDQAQAQGIKVCVGFWMRKQDGFSYRDAKMLREQKEEFRKWVRTYRRHPALLMWAVGNEVELGGEWPEVFIQTEALAQMVKQEDPNHPVIGVYADMWPEKMEALLKYCGSLDALGINSYGGLPTLKTRMKPWKKPYLITEYQFSTDTKSDAEPWAGFVEPSSETKAQSTRENYEKHILGEPGWVLGSYFFVWNQSGIGTASVHGVYLNTGEWTPVVRTMAELWKGNVPANHAPVLSLTPDRPQRVAAGATLNLDVKVTDADGDRVSLQWELLPNDPSKRFVGDFEKDLGIVAKGTTTGPTSVVMPKTPGLYRVLVVGRDGKGAAGLASLSLEVTP